MAPYRLHIRSARKRVRKKGKDAVTSVRMPPINPRAYNVSMHSVDGLAFGRQTTGTKSYWCPDTSAYSVQTPQGKQNNAKSCNPTFLMLVIDLFAHDEPKKVNQREF